MPAILKPCRSAGRGTTKMFSGRYVKGGVSMAEAASNHFVAQLGEATSEVEARLRQWAASCVEHCFVRDEISRASLYFAKRCACPPTFSNSPGAFTPAFPNAHTVFEKS